MNHIHVLNKEGFVVSTKFNDTPTSNMIGNIVKTFYDEELTLYGFYELNNDYAIVSGKKMTFEEGYNRIITLYSSLLNLIANLKGEELLDLRLQRREEPSYLRFCESILLKENIDFKFLETKTDIKTIINTLNELRFFLDVFLFAITIDNDNKKTSRYNVCHSINKTVIAITCLVQYENIDVKEEDEPYLLINKMMSIFNSIQALCLHIPEHSYYEKNENYFEK